MKKCSGCGRIYPEHRLICLDCRKALEDSTYLRFAWLTMGMALVIQLVIRLAGVNRGNFILESMFTEGMLLVTIYPAWKMVQKVRFPFRPVFREMGSVLADRPMRFVLLGLLVLMLVMSRGLVIGLRRGISGVPFSEPRWYCYFWLGRLWVACVALPPIVVAAMIDQGWAFFNPRVGLTYARREPLKPGGGKMVFTPYNWWGSDGNGDGNEKTGGA